MSPTYTAYDDLRITPVYSRIDRTGLLYFASPVTYRKQETKKERIKRIAKEKMLASWKLHNDVTLTIIKIKQYCKPINVYKPLCGRSFR